jgi:hypothetical protein
MGGRGSGRKPYKRFTQPTSETERHWPVRNPACTDIELQDEAVTELRRLWDESLANLVVDGQINPAIHEMERMERVLIDNGVILPTRNGGKSLLHFMALGELDN